MHQLVYVSAASWAMSNADLNEILDVSRRNNRRDGVTGMLLHIDRGFLQVLEGPRPAVQEIFAPIRRDPRHNAVRVLVEQEIRDRLFAGWSMGFDRLDPGQPRTSDVFAATREAIENALPPEKAADIAILLRNFYKVNSGVCAA